MLKQVVVIGDLVRDNNLLRLPVPPASHFEPVPATVAQESRGGAWYLTQQINNACADLIDNKLLEVNGPPTQRGDAARAFSVWAPYPAQPPGSTADRGSTARRVWRIEQFLGCNPDLQALRNRRSSATIRDQPELLIIDDANLGFRSRRGRWPPFLKTAGGGSRSMPTQVLLKTVSPLGGSADNNPLWSRLVERHADQLTVIVSVRAIRARGAAISQGLSWDSTLEDLHRELREGVSTADLARANRLIVLFPRTALAVYERKGNSGLAFERLVFHPEELEGSWERHGQGTVYGDASIVTAAMVRYLADQTTYPLFTAAARALAATRANFEAGGGVVAEGNHQITLASFKQATANEKIQEILLPDSGKTTDKLTPTEKLAESAYSVVCSARSRDGRGAVDPLPEKTDLLDEIMGPGYDWLTEKAMRVVLYGVRQTLAGAPKANYGRFVTVDRQEIERINEIRRLMAGYVDAQGDIKPLSIAVFGPPGSGKSFAIKQLSASLPRMSQQALEFNLSQVKSYDELTQCFHQVREATIKGQVPLVFWDEFDTNGLNWLKDFLAPMQDGRFLAQGIEYSLGKAIFVFAGGTASVFDEFDKPLDEVNSVRDSFKAQKGPDFISRLAGYVNVKGPNPSDLAEDRTNRTPKQAAGGQGQSNRARRAEALKLVERELRKSDDGLHVMRRAILLRTAIERFQPQLISDDAHPAAISRDVVRAFLWARKFEHGARSLEAIVRSSGTGESRYFGVSALPSRELLKLHVSDDFMDRAEEGAFELPELDMNVLISRLIGSRPLAGKEAADWRSRVELMLGALHHRGYRFQSAHEPVRSRPISATSAVGQAVLHEVHEIWLRDRLARGYAAGALAERLPVQPDIVPFDCLDDKTKKVYAAILKNLWTAAKGYGYVFAPASTPA